MSTLRQLSQARPIPGKPIAEYISTLHYFRDILSGTEEPITESAFISHVLMTLPSSLDTFSDILLGQHTVDELIVKIKESEDTLNTQQADSHTRDIITPLLVRRPSQLVPRLVALILGEGAEEEGSQPYAEITTFSVGIVISRGRNRRIAIPRRRLKRHGWTDLQEELGRV